MIRPITDHADRAIARLLRQFQNAPRLTGYVRVLIGELQQVEDQLHKLLEAKVVDTAAGAQLDRLAALVGQARGALDDARLRTWVKARIRLNRSSGTGNDILQVFRLLVGEGVRLRLIEQFPAALVLRIHGTLSIDPRDAAAVLQRAKAAGVRALLEYRVAPDAATFTHNGTPAQGYAGVAAPTSGGRYAGAKEKP